MGVQSTHWIDTGKTAARCLLAVLVLALAQCEATRDESGRWTFDPMAEFGAAETVVGARGTAASPGQPTALDQRVAIETSTATREKGRAALTKPEYYLSTQQVQQALPSGAKPLVSDQRFARTGPVTLNFVDANVREVVDAVLGDALGLDYVLDPRVSGTITVRTTEPLEPSAAFGLLENVLSLNGAAIRRNGKVYSVVPKEALAGQLPPTSVATAQTPPDAQGFSTHVIPLRHVAAETIEGVVEKFVAPGRSLTIDPAQNALVFVGTGQEAHSLLELVSIFDVNWMQNMSSALIPVEAADVETLASELTEIYRQDETDKANSAIRFLPIKRMSAILVMAHELDSLQEAQQWIKRLDRSDAGVGRRIFVYYVKNGKAADLANVLNQVFEPSGHRQQAEKPGLAPGLQPIEIAGQQPSQQTETTTPDTQPANGNKPPVAEPAVQESMGIEEERRLRVGTGIALGEVADKMSNVRIIPDETNNAVVVMSTYEQFDLIESALERLDVLPLQVLIEATIAEVSLTDDLRYGIKWFIEHDGIDARFSNVMSGAIGTVFPGFNFLADIPNARVVLDALSAVTNVKVISSPQIMVLDNQSARLSVGDQVPVATQSAVSVTDPEAPIVNSIQLVDTGVILEVTPRVNVGGLVVMEVNQEVSDAVKTETSSIDSPTIKQRKVTSTIAIQSGETVALGGLIRDSETRGVSKVPIMGDVPILGHLFRSDDNSVDRTELLIMITPYVVRDSRDARAVTDELRRRIRAVRPAGGQLL
jgi:general secretion pathway protein D